MMIHSPEIAATFARARQQDLQRSAARYRLAKLARRGRTAHSTPEIRPAPPARTRARAA
jgi:hypothetical protein